MSSFSALLLVDQPVYAQISPHHHDQGEAPDRPSQANDLSPEQIGLEIFIAPCYDPKSALVLQLSSGNNDFQVDQLRRIQVQNP